ncbi:MAG: hypothetical protein ACPGRE_00190 [Flavobacteriaceae bacterium]
MKPFLPIFTLLFLLSLTACDSYEPNSLLPNAQVDFTVDMNLPQYQALLIPGGYVFVQNQGIRGVYIYNLNNSTYKAFDAACPGIAASPQQACAQMNLLDGILLECPCNGNTYSILDGSPQQEGNAYVAKEYSALKNGPNSLRIRNF